MMPHHDIPPVNSAPFDDSDNPTIALPPPTSSRGHQRSRSTVDLPPLFPRTKSSSPTRFSTFLPSLKSASRSTSPERVTAGGAAEFDLDATRPVTHKHKSAASVAKLASWFEGSSDPVNLSLVPSPRKEIADPIEEEGETNTMFSSSSEHVDTLTKRPSRPQMTSGNQSSRFSFFRKTSQAQINTAHNQDELAQMDVREALFPSGPPDEFSPSAFKNLQLNAEGSLRRFQNAHLEQEKTIRSITSAKNVQADEFEAAQTKNEHLKLQLTEMAERAAEQERLISALRVELDAASRGYHNHDLQQTSIRKVTQNGRAPRYRRHRSSDISTSESETSSDVHSIFSEPMSAIDSPGTSVAASPVLKQAIMQQPQIHQGYGQYQHAAVIPVPECQKCHGVKGNEAWEVISMMKVESQALKERIAELEGAQTDALDFLSGLKLS